MAKRKYLPVNSELLSTSHGPAVILLYCGKGHQGNPERITRLASSNAGIHSCEKNMPHHPQKRLLILTNIIIYNLIVLCKNRMYLLTLACISVFQYNFTHQRMHHIWHLYYNVQHTEITVSTSPHPAPRLLPSVYDRLRHTNKKFCPSTCTSTTLKSKPNVLRYWLDAITLSS
jgi:hypothetical protein